METTFDTVSNGDLEQEMCSLQSRLAAATCHFLLAVAEYDRRRGWEAWECHDMTGWLSWKCGISPVTAREQVRVGHALDDLPLVRAEFEVGHLSYSQVRAISRVASAATEAELVGLAKVCTAAQLERVTRAYRRCTRAAAETEAKRDQGRHLRYHWDDEGNLVGQFRLPAESGAALLSAVGALRERSAVHEAEQDGATDPVAAVQADALIEIVTAGHAAITAGDRDDDSGYLVTIVTEQAALEAEPVGDGENTGGNENTGGSENAGEGLTCQIADGPGISSETARRLTCDATIIHITEAPDGTPLNVGRRTRKINRSLRRALAHRDGRRCQFPGCDRTRTEGHHIQHWTADGPTSLDNLISLCSRHHHRLHEGGFSAEILPDGIRFIRPDGTPYTPLHPAESAGVAGAGDTGRSTVAYDPDAFYDDTDPYRSDWDGTPARPGDVIDGLLQAEEHWTRTHADSAEAPSRPTAA